MGLNLRPLGKRIEDVIATPTTSNPTISAIVSGGVRPQTVQPQVQRTIPVAIPSTSQIRLSTPQQIATAITAPVANYYANKESDRAKRLLSRLDVSLVAPKVNLAQRFRETFTPIDESALRSAQASQAAAAAKVQSLGNNAKGKFANPQVRQQFVQQNTVKAPTLKQTWAGAGDAFNRAGATVGMGAMRSGVGTAQAVSGLYDLATPGKGTNRFSQKLDRGAKTLDQTVKDQNLSSMGYRVTQGLTDLGTGLAAGGAAGWAAKAATASMAAKSPVIAKVVSGVGKADEFASQGINKATGGLVKGNVAQRVIGKTIRTAANPRGLISNAAANTFYAGQGASKGQKVDPKLLAAQTAAFQLGVPLAGSVIGEGAKVASNKLARGGVTKTVQTARTLGSIKDDAQWALHDAKATKALQNADAAPTAAQRNSYLAEARENIRLRNARFNELNPVNVGLGTRKVSDENGKAMSVDPLEALKQEARKYKSVDEFVKAQGEPLYHGTKSDFAQFDNAKMGSQTDSGMYGKGFYLTPNQKTAKHYAGEKGYIKEVYADMKNPYVINTQADIPDIKVPNKTLEDMRNGPENYSRAFTKYLKDKGYDGVIDNLGVEDNQRVVFDANQLKTKQQLTDLYNQATQSRNPFKNQGGYIKNPLGKDPQVGKTDSLENLKQQATKYNSVDDFVQKNPEAAKQLNSIYQDRLMQSREVSKNFAKSLAKAREVLKDTPSDPYYFSIDGGKKATITKIQDLRRYGGDIMVDIQVMNGQKPGNRRLFNDEIFQLVPQGKIRQTKSPTGMVDNYVQDPQLEELFKNIPDELKSGTIYPGQLQGAGRINKLVTEQTLSNNLERMKNGQAISKVPSTELSGGLDRGVRTDIPASTRSSNNSITNRMGNKKPAEPVLAPQVGKTGLDEFMSGYNKRYHQTSPEVAELINKEGFRLDKRASGDNDILPIGVNTKKTDKTIRLPKEGSQVEIYFDKNANVKTFQNRQQTEQYFYGHPEGAKYRDAVDASEKLDIEYQKQVDAIGEQMHQRYKEIWGKTKAKDDPQYQALNAEEERIIKKWGEDVNRQAKIAQAESTRIAKKEGWDAIDIAEDTGGFGSVTDNTIILDPTKIKTKQQLMDAYNSSAPQVGKTAPVEKTTSQYPEILGFRNTDTVTPIMSNGKVVGGVDATVDRLNPERLRVHTIRIVPSEQGGGLGSKTINKLFEDNPGINQITGNATAEARPFWVKQGAKFTDGSTAFTLDRPVSSAPVEKTAQTAGVDPALNELVSSPTPEIPTSQKLTVTPKKNGTTQLIKKGMLDSDAVILDELRNIEKQTGQTGLVDKFMYNSNMQRGSNAGANVMLQTSENVKNAIGGLSKEDYQRFSEYANARTELSTAGKTTATSRPVDELRAIVKSASPEFQTRFDAMNAHYKELAQMAHDAGVISDKQFKEYTKSGDYIRIQRDMGDLLPGSSFGRGNGYSLGQTVLDQKRRGSTREVLPAGETLADYTQRVHREVSRNKTATNLIKNLESSGLARRLKNAQDAVNKNAVTIRENGTTVHYEVSPAMKEAIQNINPYHMNVVMQILAAPGRVMRAGVTGLNPVFIARNLLKDQASSAINSEHILATHNPASFFSGLWNATKGVLYENNDPLWQDFLKHYGDQTSYDLTRNVKDTRMVVNRIRGGKLEGIKQGIKSPIRVLENLASITEKSTRFQNYRGAYKQAIADGLSPAEASEKAAIQAWQNSVDFSRAGEWGRVINTVIPYWNPATQGVRQMGRTFVKHPIKSTLTATAIVGVPLATATAWNLSNPETAQIYNNIPEYEKDNNLIIIPPGTTQNQDGTYDVVKIPLPPGYKDAFMPIRRALEAYYNDKPVEGQKIAQDILQTVSGPVNVGSMGQFAGSFIPQAAKPLVQQYANQDLFSGQKIVPDYINNATDANGNPVAEDLKAYKNTSSTAKKIGSVLGVSPIRVEKFVKDTGGTVATNLLHATDKAVEKNIVGTATELAGGTGWKRSFGSAQGITNENASAGAKYFSLVQQVTTKDVPLNGNELAAYNSLHPSKTNFLGDQISDMNSVYNPAAQLDVYNRYPKVFEADKKINDEQAKNGGASNPLYSLEVWQVKKVLEKNNLPPGATDPELSNLYKQDWYQDYQAKRSQYYTQIQSNQQKELKAAQAKGDTTTAKSIQSSIDKFATSDNPYPTTSDALQKVMDYYTSLPSGTGARSAWIKANPSAWQMMQDQFAKIDTWQNNQRLKRGLDATEGAVGQANGYGTGSASSYGRSGSSGSANPYKYAVSINAGGTPKKVSLSSKKVALKGTKAYGGGTSKPKVGIKKSKV